ncbi:Conserved_hypothetical protein [Hexamita inflata]|uniref:Uncharacterized protein n=1 Tax=Hexamita inflata TaxID=28002 RepID=A0AA86U3U2_9EUKA|nr:Conserved hypothetical protein [Hexamita inflata]
MTAILQRRNPNKIANNQEISEIRENYKPKLEQKPQLTKKELIELQLQNQPQFDNEAPKQAPQSVSKTGLKPKMVGQGYSKPAVQNTHRNEPVIEQNLEPNQNNNNSQQDTDHKMKLFLLEKQRIQRIVQQQQAIALKKLEQPDQSPQKSSQSENQQQQQKQTSNQSENQQQKPQNNISEKQIKQTQNNNSVTRNRRTEKQSPEKSNENNRTIIHNLSNDSNYSNNSLKNEEVERNQTVLCSECKMQLNVLFLKHEKPIDQLCDICIQKKYKQVQLLQLKLLNEKKKQNIEKLHQVEHTTDQLMKSQHILSKSKTLVENQVKQFQDVIQSQEFQLAQKELQMKQMEIDFLKLNLQQQIQLKEEQKELMKELKENKPKEVTVSQITVPALQITEKIADNVDLPQIIQTETHQEQNQNQCNQQMQQYQPIKQQQQNQAEMIPNQYPTLQQQQSHQQSYQLQQQHFQPQLYSQEIQSNQQALQGDQFAQINTQQNQQKSNSNNHQNQENVNTHRHQLQPNPLLDVLQGANLQILNNFPFIIQKKICPCCDEVLGICIVDRDGQPVGIQRLEQTLRQPHIQNEPNQIYITQKEVKVEKSDNNPLSADKIKKLKELDLKLAKIQEQDTNVFGMDEFMTKQQNPDYLEENSQTGSITELGFGMRKK